MDITLIPQSEVKYSKKLDKLVITETGITQLSDCSIILMHKSGLRPLYVMNGERANLCVSPDQKMATPDLILFENNEIANQSARVVQEQLLHAGHSIKMQTTTLPDSKNFKVFKNALLTRFKNLKEKGFQHIVFLGKKEDLDQISRSMSGMELNPYYNFPIYSFLDGKPVEDANLLNNNLYMTRDTLDSMLLYRLRHSTEKELTKFSTKCRSQLEICQIKRKLHLPD